MGSQLYGADCRSNLLVGVLCVCAVWACVQPFQGQTFSWRRAPLRLCKPGFLFEAVDPPSTSCIFRADAHIAAQPYDTRNGALYRIGITKEGYGSFVGRLKSSLIMSLFFNKTLVVQDVIVTDGAPKKAGRWRQANRHGYNVGTQINQVYNHTSLPDANSSCTIEQLSDDTERRLLDAMCRQFAGNLSDSPAVLRKFQKTYASCENLVHNRTDKRGKRWAESYGDFNDCIQPWVAFTFSELFARRGYVFQANSSSPSCLNVGIHIRWGDVPSVKLSHLDKGNIQLAAIHVAMMNLRRSGRCFKYFLFSKKPSEELLAQFQFEHTLVDSGDDLADMFAYSTMDVYIQGVSTFATMASTIRPGKVIVTDKARNGRYSFPYRKQLNRVYHYTDSALIDDVASLKSSCE